MQLSHATIITLSHVGDEQAIDILRAVENKTSKELEKTKFFFQEGPGIFLSQGKMRHLPTLLGLPAITPELAAKLLAASSRQ